jgi:hypothetical protein
VVSSEAARLLPSNAAERQGMRAADAVDAAAVARAEFRPSL